MNEHECYEWVEGIISSCHNTIQLEGAKRLVDFYQEKYGDAHKEDLKRAVTDKDAQLIII